MRKLTIAHLVALVCLTVFAFSTQSIANQKEGLLKIYFFDVGQGDSIFIETPGGNQILIDGGPDDSVIHKLSEVMPFFDRSIDMVVLSHPHNDHLAGLLEVFNRYEVAKVLEAKEDFDSPVVKEWEDRKSDEEAEEIESVLGTSIYIDEDVSLEVIYPFDSLEGEKVSNPNNSSVVLMIRHGSNKILLAGDIEKPVENKLVVSNIDIDADVLKLAHHGSKTSSTEEFLKKVTPQVAVIQVGKNSYGHPSPEVLDRLENLGIPYYRNDTQGGVKILSDGIKFQVSTY